MDRDISVTRLSSLLKRSLHQTRLQLSSRQHNRAKLDELAKYLYEKETITGEEFMNILNKKEA